MKRLTILLTVIFFSLCLLGLAGARVNTTPSFPKGLYWQDETTELWNPPVKGSLVWFCPPLSPVIALAKQRGYLGIGTCAAGTQPLLKQVVGVEGDRIDINQHATRVNGRALANSAQMPKDREGKPLPAFHGKLALGQDQVLLMALDHPQSFDGRYFGPIDTRFIQGTLRPVWVVSP